MVSALRSDIGARAESFPRSAQSIKLDSPSGFWKHRTVPLPSRTRVCALLLSAFLALRLSAAETTSPAPVAELTASDAIVLGLVEGITEFLPVSSTGHLIVANQLLGLDSDRQLVDKAGQPLWHRRPSPSHPEGEPLTLKLAADTYTVVIQAGAIGAVAFYYWRLIISMFVGLAGRSSAGLRLFRNILLAFVPVATAGYLLHDFIDRYLFSPWSVIAALVGGAILMLWAERWRRTNSGIGFSKGDPSDLTPRKALGIGLAQCLALWPGTSRSMVTIVAGYLAGLNPAKAAEFSFLVGLPTLAGAAVYKSVKSGPAMIEVFGWSHVLLGAAVAAVSALVAVKFLVHFISRHGLAVFAYYRLLLALALTVFYLL
ncbi:MAG: undecaprenyl-diphosphate phosphatase [Opitutaceae bacterium]|nr:undecaprenyl-diphosphate phosphatase [Opitutaceae bacterium]